MGNEWISSLWKIWEGKKCWWAWCYVNKKSNIGYFLEVDLEYPKELHELHNDYPLAREKLAVSNDMLLTYCKNIADEYNIKVSNVKKSIPNVGNKTKYVLH